jgi:hypothetical protein
VHLLVLVLARLFEAVLKSGRVPAAWKVVKLTPILKKRGPTQASISRMIAVCSILHRLLASICCMPELFAPVPPVML